MLNKAKYMKKPNILNKFNHFMYNLIGPYDSIIHTYKHNKEIDDDIIKTKNYYKSIKV